MFEPSESDVQPLIPDLWKKNLKPCLWSSLMTTSSPMDANRLRPGGSWAGKTKRTGGRCFFPAAICMCVLCIYIYIIHINRRYLLISLCVTKCQALPDPGLQRPILIDPLLGHVAVTTPLRWSKRASHDGWCCLGASFVMASRSMERDAGSTVLSRPRLLKKMFKWF